MATKDLTIDIVPLGGAKFEMRENGAVLSALVFDKDVDKIHGQPMNKADDYRVRFTIAATHGLKFNPNANDAMWIKKGTPSSAPRCFKTKSNQGKSEFTVTRKSDYELEVANLDKNKCKFRFVLNFVDGAGSRVQYDPIMSNRNGGL